MTPLAWSLFDIYALALPRGHGFGDDIPVETWRAEDHEAFAVITRHVDTNIFGVVAMRRRAYRVWAIVLDRKDLATLEDARAQADSVLQTGAAAVKVPSGAPRRPGLFDLKGKEPSEMFKLLAQPSHINAARLLNELYLALPKPDRNWAADCQTENFHTRLWEAQLLASFREQGLLVTQPEESPDFRVQNRLGGEAWVEAVTANPTERFEHVNATPTVQPDDLDELFHGAAALRFAKTLGSKIDRRYDQQAHVAGKPFALALADFHAPSSMVWSREALIGYLYGVVARAEEVDGKRVAVATSVSKLRGKSAFPAGLFRNGDHAELSAIIFTNACTIGKFNRVMASAGAPIEGLRYVRYGKFFDRADGALDGVPFCLDVRSDDYQALWPQRREPWCAELEVFHNPHARHPLPRALMPEATHWLEIDGELVCRSHYETGVLWSRTLIQKDTDPMPTYETIPAFLAGKAI